MTRQRKENNRRASDALEQSFVIINRRGMFDHATNELLTRTEEADHLLRTGKYSGFPIFAVAGKVYELAKMKGLGKEIPTD